MRFSWIVMLMLWAGFVLAEPASSVLEVRDAGGNSFEVTRFGQGQDGPLFIWLHPQYEHAKDIHTLADALATRGAEVWTVDLLADLMLERNGEAVRNIPGEPVAALMREAQASMGRTNRPIILIACDRMAAPLLRGSVAKRRMRSCLPLRYSANSRPSL